MALGNVSPIGVVSSVSGDPQSGGDTVINNITQADPLAINEYINNLKDFHLNYTAENFSMTSVTNVNGNPVAFEGLLNAVDNGEGSLTLLAGANSAFSKRANTLESIKNLGDYFEVVIGQLPGFSTLVISLGAAGDNAESSDGYRMVFTSTSHTLFNGAEGQVAGGSGEAGTYRFTRTHFGFEVTLNGVVIYTSPEVCINYNEPLILQPANTISGVHVVSEHRPETPINITANIITGHDLTQGTGLVLRILISDVATSRAWQLVDIDIDNLLSISNNTANDGFASLFDNDFININLVDAATGEILITEAGRDFQYVRSELIAKLPQAAIETVASASSGYRDIGNVREQWGVSVFIGGSGQVVLPVPFLNDSYVITTNGTSSGENKTTTEFTANIVSGNVIEWRVIGLKPE